MEQGASCKERVLKLCGELVATCAPGGTREPDESEQLALLHQLRALAAAPDARASLRAALPVLRAALGGLSETRAVRTHKTVAPHSHPPSPQRHSEPLSCSVKRCLAPRPCSGYWPSS